jgi:hypothetical protein
MSRYRPEHRSDSSLAPVPYESWPYSQSPECQRWLPSLSPLQVAASAVNLFS